METDITLIAKIEAALKQNGPLKATEIASRLSVPKKRINSLLYRESFRTFLNNGETPPTWDVAPRKVLDNMTSTLRKKRDDPRIVMIVKMRREGKTLDEIGTAFGITREGVRQILIKELGSVRASSKTLKSLNKERSISSLRDLLESDSDPFPLSRVAARLVADLLKEENWDSTTTETVDILRQHVRALILDNLGIDSRELEQLTGLKPSILRVLAPSEFRRLTVSGGKTKNTSRWSDEELLQLLRVAGTFHFPLTGPKWNSLVQIGEIDAPSAQLVSKRFGSWSRACNLAGVESREPVREEYDRKWSIQNLERIVIDYLANEDSLGTLHDFEVWLAQFADYPSAPTVRNYLGEWSSLKLRLLKSDQMRERLHER